MHVTLQWLHGEVFVAACQPHGPPAFTACKPAAVRTRACACHTAQHMSRATHAHPARRTKCGSLSAPANPSPANPTLPVHCALHNAPAGLLVHTSPPSGTGGTLRRIGLDHRLDEALAGAVAGPHQRPGCHIPAARATQALDVPYKPSASQADENANDRRLHAPLAARE